MKFEEHYELTRKKLLDLSLRNKMLNYRPSKVKTIQVINEVCKEIYDILVLQEREMSFLPVLEPEKEVNSEEINQSSLPGLELITEKQEATGLSNDETNILWKFQSVSDSAHEEHLDRYLQTKLDAPSLQKRLFHDYQQSQSILEEQGFTVLYLALGMLEWYEDPNSDKRLVAPLLLIPLELERAGVRGVFKLHWTGEEVATNLSLQAKLKEQGIRFPDFQMTEEKSIVDEYFQVVADSIAQKSKWRVLGDVYLDFFSFTKFVMYRDLDIESWPEEISPEKHEILKEIFDPLAETKPDVGNSESEMDERRCAKDVYEVVDADPSQVAVIESAKRGNNLVVEGPPGTGKSQTITNTIAELLAANKTVLFVSEKMAALEVVKSRLDQVELGEFCLELHSRKSKKKEVLKELEKSIQFFDQKVARFDNKFETIEKLKRELNEFARAIREPIGLLNYSPYILYTKKEFATRHFEKKRALLPRVSFQDTFEWSSGEWQIITDILNELSFILPLVGPLKSHPWVGCEPDQVTPSDLEQTSGDLMLCRIELTALLSELERLCELAAISLPNTLIEINSCLAAGRVIGKSKPIDRSVLLNSEWNQPSEKARLLIDMISDYQSRLEDFQVKFVSSAFDEDVTAALEEFKKRHAKFFRIFNSRYRQCKRTVKGFFKLPPKKYDLIIREVSDFANSLIIREQIRSSSKNGIELFGSFWKNEGSNIVELKDFSEWVVAFRQKVMEKILTEEAIEIVSTGVSLKEIESAITSVEKKTLKLTESIKLFFEKVKADSEILFNTSIEKVPFEKLGNKLESWHSSLEKLHSWAAYVVTRRRLLESKASLLLKAIEEDLLNADDLLHCLWANYSDDLIEYAFQRRPSLGRFIGEVHEQRIEQFKNLDRELIGYNRQRLKSLLRSKKPVQASGVSKSSSLGILVGEFNRKRGHMSIRKLISSTGELLKKIKPCFMMSPLSISQFLEPGSISFDVIIFDEASQVRPEDAICAFLRGKQVIVMGDTRQLPPTSFFDHMTDDSDEIEEDTPALVGDVESILHQCKRSFNIKHLNWHYRSRHESLIAIPNRLFYDNRLLLYPSPHYDHNELGLKLVHLPEGIYDRGRSGMNRKEARAIISAAFDHFRNTPNKSLGIGTFNIKQQQAVFEEVELQLRQTPEMEFYFSSDRPEHFFVKNLETIQGDERDVIFISVGFGRDENGKLTNNFGPLNMDGGERRLNVLATRAREKCLLFSNFRASDLQVDESSSIGLRSFKALLEYAESKKFITSEPTPEDSDSPFEDAVYEFLRDNGFEVQRQVGCSKYKIDLALIDPKLPGTYLLGIECDGAKYHSSAVARDRDRLREQILFNQGWKLHRIWSTDWYRNRKQAQEKLLKAIHRNSSGQHVNQEIKTGSIPTVKDVSKRVEKNDVSTKVNHIDDEVDPYIVCSKLSNGARRYLAQDRSESYGFEKAINEIVNEESPIHTLEVLNRIRVICGWGRIGSNMRSAFESALRSVVNNRSVSRKGDFLWAYKQQRAPLRRRLDRDQANIELICDEEICEAVLFVLGRQFSTPRDDLVVRVANLLGIQVVREDTKNRIKNVIDTMIKDNRLELLPNNMVFFPKQK